ncbi:MAG: hypothetical protein AAGD32_05365 [Planctomycetota bacterium]
MLTPRQRVEWQIYYQLFPWGGYRVDNAVARTTQAVFASAGESSPLSDHMWHPPPTAEQLEQQAEMRRVESQAAAARDVQID